MGKLCSGNMQQKFKIECYDYEGPGKKHDFIGSVETSVAEIFLGHKKEL